MAELALIASVIQVADVGIRLSVLLYTFGQTVASADDSIVFISKDIGHTCSILKTLGHSLEKDREAHLYSQNAMSTAETIAKECLDIFHEMDSTLSRKINRIGLDGSSSRVAVVALERLKWPFLKPKMMLLWSNLDKLKSSLHLMLNVFIYARQLVERPEDPSVVNDQRSTIELLLRTTAEQTRKYETLKAAMDRNENLDVGRNSTNGYIPATPGLGEAMPTEVLKRSRIKKLLEAPEVDLATTRLENYCTLMENLMTEVEAEEYNIGHDMRCRIRGDVIDTHMRETRLLGAVHGHTELREKMREKSWRLVDMAEEKVGTRQSGVAQKQVSGYEGPPAKAPTTATDPNPRIEKFLNNREDPWNHFHLLPKAPTDWIVPLGPLKTYMRNILTPQLSFLRSGTSMLVTEGSRTVDSITSSQDLAALTDSTDTDTYVSARSELDEEVLITRHPCYVEDENDEPLVILDDQGNDDSMRKDDENFGFANLCPSSNELLAA